MTGYEMPVLLNTPTFTICGPTILDMANEEQKGERLSAAIRGDEVLGVSPERDHVPNSSARDREVVEAGAELVGELRAPRRCSEHPPMSIGDCRTVE